MGSKDDRAQLDKAIASLEKGDLAFLDLLARDLGHPPFSRRGEVDLSPADYALQWELLWRLRPDFPQEGDSDVPDHPNPFLDEFEPGKEGFHGNAEARDLLSRAKDIERHPIWKNPDEGMNRYKELVATALKRQRLKNEDSLPRPVAAPSVAAALKRKRLKKEHHSSEVEAAEDEMAFLQEAITRLVLRGRLADAIVIVRAQTDVLELQMQEDRRRKCDFPRNAWVRWVTECLPICLFAYGRARTGDLTDLIEEIERGESRMLGFLHPRIFGVLPYGQPIHNRASVIHDATEQAQQWLDEVLS